MEPERDLTQPAQRIAWAIQRAKTQGINIAALQAAMECSHVTLSQWQLGHTKIENVKVGLLVKFCQATGVSMKWILTGEGPRIEGTKPSEAVSSLAQRLIALESTNPTAFQILEKFIAINAPPGV